MRIRKTRIKEIMKTGVETIAKEVSLTDAVKKMHDLKVSSLVVEPDNDLDAYGIVTRKDIVEALIIDVEDDFICLVEDIMSKPAITLDGNLSIENGFRMMRMAGVRRLPVVEGGRLVGLVSNTDVFNWLYRSL